MTDCKRMLRREMNQKRKALSVQERSAAGTVAAERLFALSCWKQAEQIFAYCDYNGELPTESILERALTDKKRLALPRVLAPGQMEFYPVSSLEELRPGSYGIPEPDGTKEPVVPDAHTLLLLPATAFDEEGNRLGYGGGFYDRYTGRFPHVFRIGLVYEFQVVPRLPHTEFDIPVHGVITEAGARLFGDGKGCKIQSFPL